MNKNEKNCISCGAVLPIKAAFCPHCLTAQGGSSTIEAPDVGKRRHWLSIALLVLFVIAAVAGTSAYTHMKPQSISCGNTVSYRGYDLVATFDYSAEGFPEGVSEKTVLVSSEEVYSAFVNIYAFKNGERAEEEFEALICKVTAETVPVDGCSASVKLAMVDDAPGSAACAYFYYWLGCGTNDIKITLHMENGDTITFSCPFTVKESRRVSVYPWDEKLGDTHELNEFMRRLDAEGDDETVYEIFLRRGSVYRDKVTFAARSIKLYAGDSVFSGGIEIPASEGRTTISEAIISGNLSSTGVTAYGKLILKDSIISGWRTGVDCYCTDGIICSGSIFKANTTAIAVMTSEAGKDIGTEDCIFSNNGLDVYLAGENR